MQLSVVTILPRSATTLREFYARVTAAAALLTADFEFVLVNTGSRDGPFAVALELHRADRRVRVVDLSRNFGYQRAVMTGLAHARGDLVFLLDVEEDPATLGRFHAELEHRKADVVFGVQARPQRHRPERWSAAAFFLLFNLLSDTPVPANACTMRLMTRRYVDSLLAHRERTTSLVGLWALTGYEQVGLPVGNGARTARLRDLVDAVTSFTARPLVLIFYVGLGISLAAGAAAAYLIIRRLFFGVLLAGWPSVIVSIWLMGGLTLFCVGLLAIYLSKVFVESKQRPYTIVRRVYGEESER